jgi:imidazolonepropionase
MAMLIKNIGLLAGVHDPKHPLRGKALSELAVVKNAYLVIENGFFSQIGSMQEFSFRDTDFKEMFDATGQFILPAWCDSHTHLVFPAYREDEFIAKLKGASYAEIAAKGGGILNSAGKIAGISEDELYRNAFQRLEEIARLGTGTVEIKSGYGLSVEGELKMLRVIKRLKENSSLTIKSTFLGAHAFPTAYKEDHEGYISLLINEMLPVIAREKLADFIDVFCEQGFFSPTEMEKIVKSGAAHGLKAKLHVNQLSSIGGIEAAIGLKALSVDHLETMTEQDIRSLAASATIGTLLPSAAFFLRMPFQPARHLIDAGCAIALASDYNPGSSPSGNMNFVVSLSCIQMKMLPEEAINAATINGAFAMNCEKEVGSFTVGKKANLILMKPIPSISFLPYSFGSNNIDKVMIRGEWV